MVDYAADIKACVAALDAGSTILYPTDTIWGIGCDATNEAAVERVFALKNRPKEKSLIVFLPDARSVLQYIAAPPPDIIDIINSFQRPTTVVLDGAIQLASNAIADDGSVAIRIPMDEFCRALLKRFGKPIISTSANYSGEKTASTFREIDPALVAAAGYVVKYRQGDETLRVPSSIVRIDARGKMTVIRS